MQTMTLSGKEYVILERREYERVAAESGADLPALPEPNAEGLTPRSSSSRRPIARYPMSRKGGWALQDSNL